MTTAASDLPLESPTTPAPERNAPAPGAPTQPARIALLGNPNTGKTTLFNRLSGLRHKTSNFPGTTLEARLGRLRGGADDAGEGPRDVELVDLPGIYSIELDQLEAQVCRDVLAGQAAPRGDRVAPPEAVCVVVDATNLARNLMLAGEALRRRLPTVVVVNMIDLARRRGLTIDPDRLADALGCDVLLASARTGEGIEALRLALVAAAGTGSAPRGAARTGPKIPSRTPPGDEEGLRRWAEEIYAHAASGDASAFDDDTLTDRLDRAFTHPVLGLVLFAAVMGGLFYALFHLASYPMEWIDAIFTGLGGAIEAAMPEGILRDLLANGVVAGVGATVIFLPQICLLFFLISLLEDTGYLARAAFVVDRLLRPFGLPGHAFMPLLTSHACALPGIMAARAIPDRRERLATILVAPFMTCSARLPVYVLLITLLFRDRPAMAALAFVGCYALGMVAGVGSALIARRTVLRGESRPMAMELPTYKLPSLRTALITTYDRGLIFLKKAGTVILAISIVLWWLGSYPQVDAPAAAVELRERAAMLADAAPAQESAEAEAAGELLAEAERLERSHAASSSFMGQIGRAAAPVFAPLGYDWQLSIGVLSSFAAREVFVASMAVVVTGSEGEDAEEESVRERIATARRDDGTPIFTTAVCWSLLIYYVLAMQCLPTLAVTAREAGGVKWALLQLVWMSGMAYVAALAAYQILTAAGA